MKLIIFLTSFLFLSAPIMAANPDRDATLKDIKNTLGLVPTFYKLYPEDGVTGAWNEMKGLQLNPKTALSGLHKELIGLAVASQIPCRYCIYFHTHAAKLNGATDEQIREVIATSSMGRFWEAYFSGMETDLKEFMKETDRIVEIQRKRMKPDYKAPVLPPINVNDADTAYQDIERTLGLVPFFVDPIPKNSVAGIWLATRAAFIKPSSIPPKIKNLIMLAAQNQNKHGRYWDLQFAKLFGATDQEIVEAVEMAGTTRHWSTWLNGNMVDEKTFRKEADKIFAYLKKKSKK